ncbi:unnamed protein product [Lepeophtheirus salmonis]|uniref:(salmon louse) hypothetical protein n=1 Tax=Lepeophtheirus salmonis TaxID=72036 RepID=A0A7R8CDD7_LEPSM|nr:unnamed protein product [Lepeophtheirus salmonis]CAF2780031.1 unnamed protein product [Lepeophtheirus salmonis]
MEDLETSAAETDLQNEDEDEKEEEDLDSIRFASYRTASKLRALQKKSLLHHIDIWNMIESFRENGLNDNAREGNVTLGEGRLRSLVTSLYVNLGKRLPPGPAIRDEGDVLFSWLMRLTGKLMDKLRYVFSQCADGNGHLIHKRFWEFLRDLLKLAQSVGEYEAFKSSSSEVIFPEDARINVNDFLETMMSDPGPSCLSWLLVLHRVINAESVHHPVTCGYCRIRGFNGLRYKSDRANYHLCQNCFWRGKIGPEHRDDVFKEYNSYKSSSGRSSFKKSLQCIGNKNNNEVHTEGKISRSKSKTPAIPNFPEQEVIISMPTPLPHHPNNNNNNGFLTPRPSSRCTTPRNPPSHPSYSSLPRMDQRHHHSTPARSSSEAGGSFIQSDSMHNTTDEHSLIAEYTLRLNDESRSNSALHSQLVQELERKNQEIIRDITKLRQNSNNFSYPRGSRSRGGYADHNLQSRPIIVPPNTNPMLINELHGLRSKKEDLDQRLTELQSTRKDLMTELEELMKLLKNQKMFVQNPGPPPHPQFLATPSQQQQFLFQKQLQNQKNSHHQQAQISSFLGEIDSGNSPESYPPNPSSLASLSD